MLPWWLERKLNVKESKLNQESRKDDPAPHEWNNRVFHFALSGLGWRTVKKKDRAKLKAKATLEWILRPGSQGEVETLFGSDNACLPCKIGWDILRRRMCGRKITRGPLDQACTNCCPSCTMHLGTFAMEK